MKTSVHISYTSASGGFGVLAFSLLLSHRQKEGEMHGESSFQVFRHHSHRNKSPEMTTSNIIFGVVGRAADTTELALNL